VAAVRARVCHVPRLALFPAAEAYRGALAETSLRVGRVLAQPRHRQPPVRRVPRQAGSDGAVQLPGTEINLGFGGATHPLLAVRFLTDGGFDPATGLFLSTSYRRLDRIGATRGRGGRHETLEATGPTSAQLSRRTSAAEVSGYVYL
jgi:hypothetical protein